MKKFQDKVIRTIKRHRMLDSGDHVIVALSGGPDSVALAGVLLDLRGGLNLTLTLAHLHHGVRPKEADEDLEFVKGLAGRWGLPLEFEHARLGARTKSGANLEEVMRERRYAFLEKARKKHDARRIALGHNANDVAETFLINLLRGSSLSGLAGIPPAQGDLVRPLIECDRREILAYLGRKKLGYRTDSSNLDPKFLRNRIRLELIPQLARYNPAVAATLVRTAQSFRELDEFLADFAVKGLRSISKPGKDLIRISIPEFIALPQALRMMIIREAIRAQKGDLRRISRKHLLAVDSIAAGKRPNASLSLPGRTRAVRQYSRLVLYRGAAAEMEKPKPVRLKVPGRTRIDFPGQGRAEVLVSAVSNPGPKGLLKAGVKKSTSFKKLVENNIAYLDRDLLPDDLAVRPFRPGDRIRPLGMQGRRKLKDVFIEMKVPLEVRRSYPVLAGGGGIVWVPGYRVAEPYRITDKTERALKIKVRFVE